MDEHPGLRWSKHLSFIKWLHYSLVGLLVVMTVALLLSYFYVYS